MKTREIEISADCCRSCRFENFGGEGRWCIIYDNPTEVDRGIRKPQWCKATSVTINERGPDEDKRD